MDMTATGGIVWPGEPDKPRIRYLWSLRDVGVPEGGRRGLLDIIAGKTPTDSIDPRESSTLLRPQGVFADEGRYYITDPGAGRVTVIERDTRRVFHIIETRDEDILYPRGVVADREGTIYVSDADLRKVMAYSPKGKFRFYFEGDFLRPEGLAIDRDRGVIYVVDTNAHTVYRYGTDGKRTGAIGGPGGAEGEFHYPTYAFADKNGELYITDFLNFRIQIFSPGGKFIRSIGVLGDSQDALDKPKGVAVDTEGHIYIVDGRQDMVKIFNGEGRLLLVFGETGHGIGRFYLPAGIFIDGDNIIYIADSLNMRIQAFQFLGGD